jgi:competence ComEA-like helix-hairpin-helix protein
MRATHEARFVTDRQVIGVQGAVSGRSTSRSACRISNEEGNIVGFGRRRRRMFVPGDWRSKLAITAAIITVLSSAVWLVRDARPLVPSFAPAKGSMVVNINTATAEQLQTVPGIGPARAQQIIANRPYETVDDLERLSGIGPAQVESMRPFLTTGDETTRR